MKRRIVILGSTGSIGTQTVDVVQRLGHEKAEIVALVARENQSLLNTQQQETGAKYAYTTKAEGQQILTQMATLPEADTVVIAVAGAAAIEATIAACAAGKRVCIATKEVLVAAGEIVTQVAKENGATLLPIDSEHSALFQCLQGYKNSDISRLLLTASGGPFRTWTKEQIENATLADALKHPTWTMGGKITIDSATLMNKSLERIEAMWLFGVPMEQIEVVVHPQSVVHSFVEMKDGALLAQLGMPDMRLPIQIALLHPEKCDTGLPRLEPAQMQNLTFEAPDYERFPALSLATEAVKLGETAPAILNAANEAAVGLFLEEKIRFSQIIPRVAEALRNVPITPARSVEDILTADRAARQFIRESLF
jgi:1-deoxy-D-xylulose-5-phosphate reductoisomerase